MKLPKIETLVIAVFLVCVGMWGVSKCSARRAALPHASTEQEEELEDRPKHPDTVALTPSPNSVVQQKTVLPTPATTTPTPAPAAQPLNVKAPNPQSTSTTVPTTASNPPKTNGTDSKTTLYTTIDGLKVRKEPGLKSETVAKLELYEPVTFLNKKTEWTQEISLGYEKVTDHWVKIRTKSGKEGWVFGAGVHYYKMKRKGVMD